MADKKELTGRQRKAIAGLLSSRNVQEAAIAAHVGERTLYRWLTFTDFRAALLDAEGQAIDAAARRLIAMQEQAIDTLARVLKDDQAGRAVQLRAAQAVLDYLLKLRELRNIEQRLIELERTVYRDKKPG
jgi:hypothetical protein